MWLRPGPAPGKMGGCSQRREVHSSLQQPDREEPLTWGASPAEVRAIIGCRARRHQRGGVAQIDRHTAARGGGGSDRAAVGLACAMEAAVCQISTAVDGVFPADPRSVRTARRIPWISYEEMLEMAACGAKILQLRCVEYARRYGMPIHVRSSFSNRTGTTISEANQGTEPARVGQGTISAS